MEGLKKGILVRNGTAVGAVGDKYFSNAPIGVIQAFSGQTAPHGYLLCNGASYKVADYPDLYAVIGNTYGGDTENFNVPDYRETVLVGIGENTTDTIASHDVYGLGEFKDDQLQIITGTANIWGYSGALNPTGAFGQDGTTEPTYSAAETAMGSKLTFNSSNVTRSSSSTNVTHGKQKGVTYIIKAFHTNEGVDSGVSDDVVNYVNDSLMDKADKSYVDDNFATMDKVFKYSGLIEANITSGYVQTNNPLGVECYIICSKMYTSDSTPNGLSVTGQTTNEKINIYVRNADGTLPPDGTEIKIAFILF